MALANLKSEHDKLSRCDRVGECPQELEDTQTFAGKALR